MIEDNEMQTLVVYYDVSTGRIYDAAGTSYENNSLSVFLDSEYVLELHYVNNALVGVSPEEWDSWSSLDSLSISSTLSFDEDYIHAFEGTVVDDVEKAAHTIVVNVSGVNKDTLSPFGILIINPFGSEIEQEVVSYSSFSYISKDTYSFTIEDSLGVPSFISKGTPIRVSDPMFLFVDSSKVYEANIPERYSEGIFKFPMHILSRKLLKALDNTNIKGVSGKLEHKIYNKQSKLVGIQVSGEFYTRDRKKDKVALDVNESKTYLFCGWSNDTNSYWTKGNNVTDASSLYLIENGNAVLTQDSLICSFEEYIVPLKVFHIYFIVKNLVDYNVTLNVPVQAADWMKSYIINTVKSNIDFEGGHSIDIGNDYDEAPPT